VTERKERTNVFLDMSPPIPYCAPLMMPHGGLDPELEALLRKRA
jgi:hypothetical protein